MNLSPRDRNIIIGAAASVVVVGILAFFIGRSTGGEEAATTSTTPTVPAPTTPTQTTPAQTQPAPTVAVPAETTPATSPGPAAIPLPEIIEVKGPPPAINTTTTISFEVKVRGVTVEAGIALKPVDREYGGGPFMLSRTTTVGDVTTFTGTWGTIGGSGPGEYHYRAFAIASDGKTFVDSPYTNLTVTP